MPSPGHTVGARVHVFASRTAAALITVCAALGTHFALAQSPNLRMPPHVGYAYPAGGQIGTTVMMSVGGQNLIGTNEAHFSVPGITARVIGYDRPMTQKEFNDLREKIQALQDRRAAALGEPNPAEATAQRREVATLKKAGRAEPAPGEGASGLARGGSWTADDQRQLAELRAMLAKRPNRQGNPAIAETIQLEVSIPSDAPPGPCELRLKTPGGLSNPLRFELGTLPEFVSPAITATNAPPASPSRETGIRPKPRPTATEVTLPVTINGQILPGEVDQYRFVGKRDQPLTVTVSARTLLPYLADAVPGWFQATLALYDDAGRELAYSDSFEFSPDPVVCYTLPHDGVYVIEIKDSIYRGREDFVYRIAAGELPFVKSVFPLGGRPATAVQFAGWNLPAEAQTTPVGREVAKQLIQAFETRGALSNAARRLLDADAACLETEPNDTVKQAQDIVPPSVVDGRIERAGDVDIYRFSGKANETIAAEVFARRLGSPVDSVLTLADETGRQLAFNDDHEDKGAGLMTHQADSRITAVLPKDGTYFLSIADSERHGGSEYAYRLRVGTLRPDFELRVVPSGINVAAGANVPLTVYALRRDGFTGEIALALVNAPRGFTLSGGRIPANEDHVELTLAAPRFAREGTANLNLEGTAATPERTLAHRAIPADDLMQAFAYHHLVPAAELLVDVIKRPTAAIQALEIRPVPIPLGGAAIVKLRVFVPRAVDHVSAELSDASSGVSVKEVTFSGTQVQVVVTCDAQKAKLNQSGNLVLNLFGERANPNTAKGTRTPSRIPIGTAPAVPFEIVGPSH